MAKNERRPRGDDQEEEQAPLSTPITGNISELQTALNDFLQALYTKLSWNKQQLAKAIGRHHTTILGWTTGHRPNFEDMNALLRLNVQHEIVAPLVAVQLFRLWLIACGFTTEQGIIDPIEMKVLDLLTGQSAREQLRRMNTEKSLLRKGLAWSLLLRELEGICREFKYYRQEFARTLAPAPDTQRIQEFSRRVGQFIEEVMLQRVCALYVTLYQRETLVFRGAIYTLTQQDGNYLAIRWQKGLLYESVRQEHWYCGASVPPAGERLGIVGHVFRQQTGEIIADVIEDERLKDGLDASSSAQHVEYRSLVATPIMARDGQRTLGVLAIGGTWPKLFNDHDHTLINELAQLLGHLLEETQIPYRVDYDPPFTKNNSFSWGVDDWRP